MDSKLAITFAGTRFRNPVIVASTDIGRLPSQFEAFARAGVGGIVTKSVTDSPALQQAGIAMFDIRDQYGAPVRGQVPDQYRFFSRGGSMVSMEDFQSRARQELEIARRYGVVPIASISASRVENWVAYARQFEAMGYPMLELNFGNPHGEAAKDKLGFLIAQSAGLSVDIAAQVIQGVDIPVVVKLTPQVADLAGLAQALEQAGVRAVTITHRFQGLVIDQETGSPVLGGFAAIGGPWMKPLTLASVAKVYRSTGLEIMGSNGADTAEDVLDFIYAGAGAVQIGSSMMLRGPEYAGALVRRLGELMAARGAASVEELRGKAARRIVPYRNLSQLPARRAKFDLSLCGPCLEKPCAARCWFGALAVRDGSLFHDDEHCSGCGLCRHICPHAAVTIENLAFELSSGKGENEP